MSKQRISRRRFLRGLGAASGALFFSPWRSMQGLAAQGLCPQVAGKKVRWIVPTPPGGGFDIYSRLITPFYEKVLGGKIFIRYVPGAGTIIGSKRLKDAEPNGLTLGILNAPALLVALLTGKMEVPNLTKDFTILGRVTRSQQIWAARGDSRFQSMADVFAEAEKRPIVFGITEVTGSHFTNIAITSFLLGIDVEFIPGYKGSRGASLATLRGEVDLVAFTFGSIFDMVKAGDLRPLLQISLERISPHTSLEDVPLLGGDEGLAARRAAELGREVEEAKADARALAGLLGAGRVIAAPLGLEKDLSQCLEQGLYEALTDPAFEKAAVAANRSLDVARADVAISDLQAAMGTVEKFIPIVQKSIKKVQQ